MNADVCSVIAFAVGSGWFLYISRKSLRVVRSHGFYRFFAFEAMLAMVLVNRPLWFVAPCSTSQIVSWILLTLSLILAGLGLYEIRVAGRPSSQRKDDTLFSFEKTLHLVTSGIYRYVRHPMYSSLLFLAWGTFLKDLSWLSVFLVIVTSLFLFATAKADEVECVRYFGSAYDQYKSRTKMFVPYLF
jgi:protein-S-isoprenylcysteine O-methyltransferase Ste14